VFRSFREEAAPSVCFVVGRRTPWRYRGSVRHAAGTDKRVVLQECAAAMSLDLWHKSV